MLTTAAPSEAFTLDEFQKLRDFFYRKTGIFFEDTKRYFVDKRVRDRMESLGCDFRSYFTTLRFQASGVELQQLVNLLTVNETYFMREEYQMQCLVRSMLGELTRREGAAGRRVRVWSIPSSTGEEPYSLAIYLLEHWPEVNDYDVEIVASDIDTEVLAAAARGTYGARSVQYVPRHLLHKYFKQTADGQFQVCDELRSSIDFRQVNLHDSVQTRLFYDFDVIFCRNLLIYFDEVSRRRAAETLYDALNPGGFLCLGHSESMSRMSSLFEIRKFPDAIVYQKPLGK